ncbi:MAG TPA: hypothetical protein VHG93_04375 [Longimicrobium sp.]|nr:hypothetical protein [Longimicrobium sp.]
MYTVRTVRTWLRSAALSLSVLAAASCTDAPAAGGITAPEGALASNSSGPTPLECPVDSTVSASGLVGPLGGVVGVGGHQLVIPPLAVLLPTQFTVTVPASQYVRVDVTAGNGQHFQFRKPVTLTLSYARCTRSDIDKENLRIYYVDDNNAILEDLGGTDDKNARTVTTGTDHLSGYLIGEG